MVTCLNFFISPPGSKKDKDGLKVPSEENDNICVVLNFVAAA